MKHSKTSRTLKTNASLHNLELGLSKRTIPRNSNTTVQKFYTRKLSSPQKELKNWCKIEQSILHNIYDLKQLKPDEEDFATANRYREVLMQIEQKEREREQDVELVRGLRGELDMVKEDRNSSTLRNIDLLSEMEELEEIMDVYVAKYPEQSSAIFHLLTINATISELSASLSILQSQLQDLSELIPTTAPTPPSTLHLNHRIHSYRLQLLQLQQKLNECCTSKNKPLLREILCHFYISHKQNQQNQQIGIQLWVCKNSLVSVLDKYVFANYRYMKEECFKEYLEYLQVLTKIEMNFVEIERINTISEIDTSENILYCQKKLQCEQLKEKLSQLDGEKVRYEQEMSQLWSNEQLFRLQCDMGKYDPKLLLKEVTSEQIRREESIRMVKLRLGEIERCQEEYKVKKLADTQSIQELEGSIQLKCQAILKMNGELVLLEKEKGKKETRAATSRLQEQKSPEHLDEEIEALQKKLSKLQQRKMNIVQSKFHQTPKGEGYGVPEISSNLISPISKNKRGKTKSATKITKQAPTYHTIAIKPYEPLDKAINRLVSFKKTLANDKMKLNKQMSKLMKHI